MEQNTKRSLTDLSDILNVITGVFRSLENALGERKYVGAMHLILNIASLCQANSDLPQELHLFGEALCGTVVTAVPCNNKLLSWSWI